MNLNEAMEKYLPWWLNNLVRWVVMMMAMPFFLMFEVLCHIAAIGAVFSRGSVLINWPWEWDWGWPYN